MTGLYETWVRPLLFQLDPETAHEMALNALQRAADKSLMRSMLGGFCCPDPLPVQIGNLVFPNPVGLAAGMDKHAKALPMWPSMGFGFVEMGGVTLHPQPGNPQPRMFRAPTHGGIINRMGFNNPGVDAMIQQLKYWRDADLWPSVPVGLNLGKSKITPLEEAPEEYGQLVETCWPWADFLVLNISSPNTPELRQLQGSNALDGVLRAVQQAATRAAASHPDSRAPSLWVKVDPDLSPQALDELLETCLDHNLFGIVATNTTTRRPRSTTHTEEEAVYHETGGLSGKPLRDRSTEVIQHIYRQCGKKLTIMGVGGIFSAKDAWEKVGSGASLLQIYSALVYKGPSLVKEVVDGLRHQLSLHGLASLNQAVGSQLPYLSV